MAGRAAGAETGAAGKGVSRAPVCRVSEMGSGHVCSSPQRSLFLSFRKLDSVCGGESCKGLGFCCCEMEETPDGRNRVYLTARPSSVREGQEVRPGSGSRAAGRGSVLPGRPYSIGIRAVHPMKSPLKTMLVPCKTVGRSSL